MQVCMHPYATGLFPCLHCSLPPSFRSSQALSSSAQASSSALPNPLRVLLSSRHRLRLPPSASLAGGSPMKAIEPKRERRERELACELSLLSLSLSFCFPSLSLSVSSLSPGLLCTSTQSINHCLCTPVIQQEGMTDVILKERIRVSLLLLSFFLPFFISLIQESICVNVCAFVCVCVYFFICEPTLPSFNSRRKEGKRRGENYVLVFFGLLFISM